MPQNPETKFKNRILPLLRSIPFSWWMVAQMLSLIGIPDLIGVINGRFVALELKVVGGRVSKMQLYIIEKIILAGGYAEIVYPKDWERVYEELKTFGQQSSRT